MYDDSIFLLFTLAVLDGRSVLSVKILEIQSHFETAMAQTSFLDFHQFHVFGLFLTNFRHTFELNTKLYDY